MDHSILMKLGMMNRLNSNNSDLIFASRYEKNAGSEDDFFGR